MTICLDDNTPLITKESIEMSTDITAILEEIEMCADHHLGMKVKNVEYGYNAQDMTEALLRKVIDLLSTNVVIDKETAENIFYELDHEGLYSRGREIIQSELARITTEGDKK